MKGVGFTIAAAAVLLTATFWPREASPHNPITTTVLFNREVSKILAEKCLACHVEGSLSIPLRTYKEARPWAVAIKEEVLARRMPPWPAERGFTEFSNDAGLTSREIDFLISWIDGGVPEGTGAPSPFFDHSTHWMLGEPDALATVTQGVTLEPGSGVRSEPLTIETDFKTDRWIRAIDYKPGSKRVTRAAVLTVGATNQYLGAWTPWQTATQWPNGVAVKLPAGSRITINAVYQTADERVVDTPTVALYFASGAGVQPLNDVVLEGQARPRAPAAAMPSHHATRFKISKDTVLFAIRPELPAHTGAVEVSVKRPDGSSEVVLWIQRYRPEWQTPFILKRPITIPMGSEVRASVYLKGGPDTPSAPFRISLATAAQLD